VKRFLPSLLLVEAEGRKEEVKSKTRKKMQAGAEYQRGYDDAKAHKGRVDENWLRSALGPLVWLGLPMAATVWYLRRSAAATMGAGASKKASFNPFENMMEMMNPIPKRQFRVDVKGTKFNDVIGVPEAKEDVKQYVEFLTNPDKFTRLGARLPKGCLLTGEPGTGKTLLAKAVAGEANVPFFSCNGADFIEIMGGSGPKRVRELFNEARECAPCIVFIDELDAIGSRSGGERGGSISSEENRTINQLLAELDGLSTSADPIVVVGATNFQDNIDKALLREGRFDRKVNIDMPDRAARVDLFHHYLNKVITGDPNGALRSDEGDKSVPPDPSVSNAATAVEMADLTPGVSPATIATIVNESALQAALRGAERVSRQDLMEAIDNTLLGKKHRNRMSDRSAYRTAIHESGHALAAWMLPQQKPVLKISVQPRGKSLGYTQRAGSEYHEYQTNATLFTDMVVMMGGRAAEDVLLGDPSTGAMDDLQRATDMAMKELLAFGMSPRTGLLAYHPDSSNHGRSFVKFSEGTQRSVEEEAKRIVEEAYAFAKTLVTANKDKVETMAKELVEKKEVLTADVQRLWGERPTSPSTAEVVVRLHALHGGVKVSA
jgi:ATP-dependent metalloprotease FtsH